MHTSRSTGFNGAPRGRAVRGFSLVELIVVLTVTGIIAAVIGVFIVRPVEGFLDQSRRAELVDVAEMSLQRAARELRRALPNSVRVSLDGRALELIHVRDAGRYRVGPGSDAGGNPDRRLQFNIADQQFNVMGPRQPAIGAGDRLVVFNLGPGQPDGDAYAGDAVITPASVTPSIAPDPDISEFRVTLSPGHQFALESPARRLFVVDGAVAYVCDLDAGTMRRQTRAIQGNMPGDFSQGALVADGVTECEFSYDPGTATRNAVVSMLITVEREGEQVTLLRQVHMDNAP